MLRENYKASLKQLGLSKSQQARLLEINESAFSKYFSVVSEHPLLRGVLLDGLIDGVNSMYRYLSGNLLSHDEFEDAPLPNDINCDVALSDFNLSSPGMNALVDALQAVSNDLAGLIKSELSQQQLDAFFAAMHDLAKPRLFAFKTQLAKGSVNDYHKGLSLWWTALFSAMQLR